MAAFFLLENMGVKKSEVQVFFQVGIHTLITLENLQPNCHQQWYTAPFSTVKLKALTTDQADDHFFETLPITFPCK